MKKILILLIFIFFVSLIIYANDLLVISTLENQDILNDLKNYDNLTVFDQNDSQYDIVINHVLDFNYIKQFFNNEYILILYSSLTNIDDSLLIIFYDNNYNKIIFSFKINYYNIKFLKQYLFLYIKELLNLIKINQTNSLNELLTYSLSIKTISENNYNYYVAIGTEDFDTRKILLFNIILKMLNEKNFYLKIKESYLKKKINVNNLFEILLNIVSLLENKYDESYKREKIYLYLYNKEFIKTKLTLLLNNDNISGDIKLIISFLIF